MARNEHDDKPWKSKDRITNLVECDCCGVLFPKAPNKVKRDKTHMCSNECKSKMYKGSGNSNWRGGICKDTRADPRNKEWRLQVYRASNFTCEKCGKRGGDLQAHHILAFARFPEARHIVDNGATLCKSCHKEFHSAYGLKKFSDKDYFRWLQEPSKSN